MEIQLGCSTASPFNVRYRIQRIARYIKDGDWLDYGCADGGYTRALLNSGAATAYGVDVASDRVAAAQQAHPDICFRVNTHDRLPFQDGSFDGVFMNEVFEHVADETRTLQEIHRVLRSDGYLIVISPNRGFPFEGHTVSIGNWSSKGPTPIVPWLPRIITDKWVSARNYWPGEMRRKISSSGFAVTESGFIMPVFEAYPWIPASVAQRFRRHVSTIDHFPGIQRFGVSNLVIAQRQNV